MKLATISTLWDYINRAMPWTAPKTLTTEEVYAVTAYILNLGDIVPNDFVLSDRNMAEVQKLLPNRNGFTRDHGLWDIKGKGDVKNVACMKNCPGEIRILSELPDHAKNAHGNLAEQSRTFGPVRGVETRTTQVAQSPASKGQADPKAMAVSSGCLACHGVSTRSVGPAFTEVAQKYGTGPDAHAKVAAKVKAGGAGAWGGVPMPPQPQLKDEELHAMVGWILSGAK
jgi:cytochrome c